MSIKKVYAEYHNPRYTRDMKDDSVGNWKYERTSEVSKARIKRYNFNADLIDENGQHQLATVNYPLIGMQSQNDPDYIEYQILLAQMAGIDGFLTDFRHLEDQPGINQLTDLQKVAKKYKFEIGVDWCDAQIFYTLQKYRPDLDTRQKQIDYCKNIFQYITDNVCNSETAPNIDGHPIVFLFGDGYSIDEYKYLMSFDYESEKEPWYFRRAMMECELTDENKVRYTFDVNHPYFNEENRACVKGPFGWVPFRIRDAVADGLDLWDVYATKEDCIAYLETLRQYVNKHRDIYKALISIVTPGMDHRGCTAWGRQISYIKRGNGEIYEAMWQYNVEHKDDVNAVFISSWNDYNEGHEIEPTVENGYRELITTSKYTAQLKSTDTVTEECDFKLPATLFHLRKKLKFYQELKLNIDTLNEILDEVGLFISNRKFDKAKQKMMLITEMEKRFDEKIQCHSMIYDNFEVIPNKMADMEIIYHGSPTYNDAIIYLRMDEETSSYLRENYFEGYLYFEYFDDGYDTFSLYSATNRYSTVCQITKDNTSTWKKAKVKLYKCNTALSHTLENESDFKFTGTNKLRNFSAEFNVYNI